MRPTVNGTYGRASDDKGVFWHVQHARRGRHIGSCVGFGPVVIWLMLDELRELYQEVILDHGNDPRNFR